MMAGEEHKTHEHKENGSNANASETVSLLIYSAIAFLVLLLAFNQYQIASINNQLMVLSSVPIASGSNPASGSGSASAVNLQAIADRVIPKGVPEVYGTELGVSFDEPVKGLEILGKLDGDLYPDGKLKYSQLNADAQKRYVAMGNMIACEYCCGANALVLPNGQPACGCQHSAAMRGLAKYLLINYPNMSDERILEEMSKLKILYFPKQHISKAVSFASAGMDSNINPTDLASNEFRGFKPSSSNGASVANAPDMVGGC